MLPKSSLTCRPASPARDVRLTSNRRRPCPAPGPACMLIEKRAVRRKSAAPRLSSPQHDALRLSRLPRAARAGRAARVRAAGRTGRLSRGAGGRSLHPWLLENGHSGFVWSWLGAALHATVTTFGTVTVPGDRYHPAISAQAAATLAQMFPGRFWLAVGSGEAVNEHVTGRAWPPKSERNARLRECADVMRALARRNRHASWTCDRARGAYLLAARAATVAARCRRIGGNRALGRRLGLMA